MVQAVIRLEVMELQAQGGLDQVEKAEHKRGGGMDMAAADLWDRELAATIQAVAVGITGVGAPMMGAVEVDHLTALAKFWKIHKVTPDAMATANLLSLQFAVVILPAPAKANRP